MNPITCILNKRKKKLALVGTSCFRYRLIILVNVEAFEDLNSTVGKLKLGNYSQDAADVLSSRINPMTRPIYTICYKTAFVHIELSNQLTGMFQSDLYCPLTISCIHGHGCHSRTQGLTSRRPVKGCYDGRKIHFPRNSKEEVQCWILLRCIREGMYFGKLQSFFFQK